MKIGACGITCEVCGNFTKGVCQGCSAGTGESASDFLASLKEKYGSGCLVLECALNNKVGYCLKDCSKFPCDVLYQEFPYSKGFLDIFKGA